MRQVLLLVTLLIIAAFIAVGTTLLAPTSSPLAQTSLYMFFGGIVVLMVAIVLLVKTNHGIERLVGKSSLARMAFGIDVALFSMAIAGLIARFFVLNPSGFQGYHLVRYIALGVIALAAIGCAVLGLAVAAGLKSPTMLFELLRQLNKEGSRVSGKRDQDPD